MRAVDRFRHMCRHRRFQIGVSVGTSAAVIITFYSPVAGAVFAIGANLVWIWEQ